MTNKTYENLSERLYLDTLPNGLAVYVLPRPDYARSFAFFATNYGGAMRRFRLNGEPRDTPEGVAHFLEHKMFDMPDGNALGTLSANGASPNAFTSSGITAYHFESTQGFDENLHTLLNFVSTPYFTAESVQKEQGIIGQEVRMTEDDPYFRVYNDLLRALYAENPIRDSVVGTVESISHISEKTLYDCHSAFYSPSNMVLCVAGGNDPESVLRIARETLPSEKAPVPEPDFGAPESELPLRARSEREMAVSAPQFMLGSKIKPAEKGRALLRQKLVGSLSLRCLLGRSSPFYNGLYAEGLLRGDFDAEIDYSAGTATFLAGGESANPEKVLERLCSEAARIAQSGQDAAAFERARRAAYGSRLRGLEVFDNLCYDMALGHFGGYLSLDAFELLPEITALECEAFIAENIRPEKLSLSVVKPLTSA
ncbi:MAG: pitrilysin family protein [Oscillospiraceae bacterium]